MTSFVTTTFSTVWLTIVETLSPSKKLNNTVTTKQSFISYTVMFIRWNIIYVTIRVKDNILHLENRLTVKLNV